MNRLLLMSLLLLCLSGYSQNTVPMKDYIDMQSRLQQQQFELNREWNIRYNDAMLAAQKEANELVRLALDDYKVHSNEYRLQLKEQAGTFVTKTTFFSILGVLLTVIGILLGYINSKKKESEKFREGTKDDKIKKEVEV